MSLAQLQEIRLTHKEDYISTCLNNLEIKIKIHISFEIFKREILRYKFSKACAGSVC